MSNSRSPRQTYAVAVCFSAVVLFAVSVGVIAFSTLRIAAPSFTGERVASAKLEIYHEPIPSSPDGKLTPEEAMYADRDRKLKAQQIENQVLLEQFRARRAMIIWGLLAISSAALWVTHWRMLRI